MSIQLDDLIARLRLDTSGVSSGLGGLNSSLSSVGTKATATGRRLTLGVTTPIIGLGIASTNLAAGFDKTMRQVAIATDGPSKALSDLAKRMGAETAFSANEAADAMLELAKGGMTAAQIEGGALAATMKLAAAGNVDLAAASTFVSNSMAAYGLHAKDADKVTVALAGAANASSASVESLGLGLSQAAASARNAGLSLQETTGVLSYFDSVGLKGSDAGTSLKSMFNGLIPTTEKAAKAQRDANLDFVDAEGNFVSVANMAEQLRKGLGGLGEAQRAQALETIFGSDGMRAASALMRGGAEEVRKYTKASKDQKTTTELANAAMDGTAGAMERAKGSIETAGLALGEGLAPHVEHAAKVVEDLANKFTALSPETQGVIVKGLALAAVVGPLTVGVGVLASSLSKIIAVTSSVRTGIGSLTGSLAEGETRMSRFAGTARLAGGTAGLAALTFGLQRAADKGATFGSVMSAAAGGAGVGAMFGPIGALVGAAGGAGLAALAGSLHETAEEAEAARIELLKTTGFKAAKADAETLSTALQGVVNAYGQVPRAAVKASFTGEDGKLDADIAKLRDLGVSMDTIISATLGQRDAQRLVERALGDSIRKQEEARAAAKASLDAATDAANEATITASKRTVATREQLQAVDDARAAEDKAAAAYAATKGPLDELTALQGTFSERVRRNTGVVAEHREVVRKLSADLGLTVQQYHKLPANVRTRVEADGLPQTVSDSLALIGQYKSLQSFRNIRAIIEATDAPLTIQQIETLKKRYDLTPKQVKTLIQAVGVEAETEKIVRLRHEAEDTAGEYRVNVHTSYTYSGKKAQIQSDFSPRAALGGDKGKSDGIDYADDFAEGVASGFGKGTAALMKAADAATNEAAKTRKARIERVGRLLSSSLADGIVGNRTHVTRALQGLMDQLEKIGNDGATRIATSARRQLRRLGDDYETTRRKLAAAEKALESLSAARAVVEARQGALAAAGGDLGSLTFGDDTPVTAQAVIAALSKVATAANDFDSNLQQLRDAGLSQDALDQLIAKGPEAAAATAQAILAGGPEAIAQINALQTQIATSGLAIQTKSSQTMYAVGVAAQQGLIDGLESQMELLESQMTKIAKTMVRAIRKALKIKSPSRVMVGLGEFTGEGFAQGIDSTVRAVEAASSRMADAALIAPVTSSPGVATAAALRATVGGFTAPPQVRVFIGDRELTDIVRVEMRDAVTPLATAVRQGVPA